MRQAKKEYLNQYLLQEPKIQRLKMMSQAEPERKERYLREAEEAIRLRHAIEDSIEAVPDPLLSEILYQKYIFGKTLMELSLIINYSPRQTERLHIKALEAYSLPEK